MPARMTRWIGCGFCTVSAILIGLAGCHKNDSDANKDTAKANAQVEVRKDNQGKTIEAQPVGLAKGPKLPAFKDSVILDDPPEGEIQPPNVTYTRKNAIKIFETIANDLWDKVTFTNDDGKPIKYRAIIATELGDIHVNLFGDAAPNHVRSFVCLAKAGYYDGTHFYYRFHGKVEDTDISFIEAGCPRGTGEVGSGSIGYWLRPEVSPKLTHDEGVLGASLGCDPNSAACRFYITAVPTPAMDGSFTIFGKVTQGLDVVRTINKREVRDLDLLVKPVLIKSVTIRTVSD